MAAIDPEWMTAIRDVGFPIVAAVAGALAVWAVVKWLGAEIIKPVRDRAFRFLDKIEGNVDAMSQNLDQQTSTLQEINGNQAEIKSSLRAIVQQGCGAAAALRNGGRGHE